jgi:hypothetical protein
VRRAQGFGSALLALADQRPECECTGAQRLCVVRRRSPGDALSPRGLPQGEPEGSSTLTDARSAQMEVGPGEIVVTDEHRGTSIGLERVVEKSGAISNVSERQQQSTPFEFGDMGQPP